MNYLGDISRLTYSVPFLNFDHFTSNFLHKTRKVTSRDVTYLAEFPFAAKGNELMNKSVTALIELTIAWILRSALDFYQDLIGLVFGDVN